MAESIVDEVRRVNILRFLRYARERFLPPIRFHIKENTIAFGAGIVAAWAFTMVQYLMLAETLEASVIISILLTIVFIMGWVITVPRYLIMYVKQKRRIKHCTHLVASKAPFDEITQYIESFLNEPTGGW